MPRRITSKQANMLEIVLPCKERTLNLNTSCSQANLSKTSKTCEKEKVLELLTAHA